MSPRYRNLKKRQKTPVVVKRPSRKAMAENAKVKREWSVDPIDPDDPVITREVTSKDLTDLHVATAIEGSRGSLRLIAQRLGCSRQVAAGMIKRSEDLTSQLEDEIEASVDTLEEALYDKVASGDTPAIIFGLKTRGRKRGYSEKIEVDQNISGTILGITATPDEAASALSDVMASRVEAYRLMQQRKAEYAKVHGLSTPQPPSALDEALRVLRAKDVTPATSSVDEPDFLK